MGVQVFFRLKHGLFKTVAISSDHVDKARYLFDVLDGVVSNIF